MGPPETFKTIDDLKVMWKRQEERGVPIRRKKLVDVCIISYKEEGYIEPTIDKMMNQTLWKDELMNIVVGEYTDNPRHMRGERTSYLQELCRKNKVLHTFVPRKGVGFARNWTIVNGSISDIVMSFDADSRFNRDDAVHLMVAPIISKQAEMTHCESVIVPDTNPRRRRTLQETAYRTLLDYSTYVERVAPIGRAQGLTITRKAFFRVNGFPDSLIVEDYPFHWRFSMVYGLFARKFIEEVKVLSSDRRVKAISRHGIVGAIDYHKRNFR